MIIQFSLSQHLFLFLLCCSLSSQRGGNQAVEHPTKQEIMLNQLSHSVFQLDNRKSLRSMYIMILFLAIFPFLPSCQAACHAAGGDSFVRSI